MNKKLKDDVQLTPIEELIKEDLGLRGQWNGRPLKQA